jgi:hypothetical protein
MIKEIPVRATDKADVRLQDNEASAWTADSMCLPQLLDHDVRVRKVLEVIAHENRSEVVVGEHTAHRSAAHLHKVDVLGEVASHVTNVGRPAFSGPDIADEVTAVGSHVEHWGITEDEALQVGTDLSPYRVLCGCILSAEARLVETIQVAAWRLRLWRIADIDTRVDHGPHDAMAPLTRVHVCPELVRHS